ncbi:MAG: hypothetical protein C0593_00845 [Marinilabiliales bacterium]|nr:MAG: hypothetical protein C0593_00845 [Marinilabiliales bacterium]
MIKYKFTAAILLLIFISFTVLGQSTDYVTKSINTNIAGMYVLGSLAAANLNAALLPDNAFMIQTSFPIHF